MDSPTALRVVLFLAAGAALLGAAMAAKDRQKTVTVTVDAIESQLASLDPATRAAVISRLGEDAIETIRRT